MIKQEQPVEINILPDKVVFLIEKAKEFDAKDVVTETDLGSNAVDDNMIEVLENQRDDETLTEIFGFINLLNIDEQIDLVALMWLGREDHAAEEDWPQLRAEAAAAHNRHSARYLAGTPLLGDFLEAGLETLNYPVAELESAAFQ